MATNIDQRGFIQQLQEMRTTRTQQLRSTNQQAALLNKQINVLTKLDKTMTAMLKAQGIGTAALRDVSSKQTSVVKQNEQMTKSINNLSSSVMRSMSSMASAVGRGTKGAAGAVGNAAVGGASMIGSGIMKALPFVIAGAIGKTMVWDKMDEGVKKQLGESFGGLMKGIFGSLDSSEFGKSIKPITKELGIQLGALSDTLEAFGKKISSIAESLRLPKTFGEGVDRAKEKMEGIKDKAGDVLDEARFKARVGSRMGSQAYEAVTDTSLSDSTALKVLGAGGVVAGGVLIAKGMKPTPAQDAEPVKEKTKPRRIKSAKKPRLFNQQDMAKLADVTKYLKENKLAFTKQNMLVGRVWTSVMKQGGPVAKAFGEAVVKYKIGRTFALVGLAVELIGWWVVENEIAEMEEMGPPYGLTTEEADALRKLARISSTSRIVSATVFGALGAFAGAFTGPAAPVAVPLLGVGGTIVGSELADLAVQKSVSLPESLTKELPEDNKGTARSVAEAARKTRRHSPKHAKKTEGVLSSSSASTSSDSFEMFKGAIGGAESRGDYNARNKNGSSASGKYQVIKSTFESFAKDKDSPVYGMTWDQFQKSDPEVQEALMDYMLQYYNQVLLAGNVPVNEKTLYLAHFLGAETAVKVYNANPNDPLSKYITKNGQYDLMVKQNPGLVTPGTTTSEIQLALGKRVTTQMAHNKATNSRSSFASLDPRRNDTNVTESDKSLYHSENVARRRAEAEKNEPSAALQTPEQIAAAKEEKDKKGRLTTLLQHTGLDVFGKLKEAMGSVTDDLMKGYDENFALQNVSQIPSIDTSDKSTTVVNVSSGGGGGGPSINSVISNHMYNQNWQFSSLSGVQRS